MHDKTKGWRVRRMHEWMGRQTGRRVDRRPVLIRQTWTLQAHLCERFSLCFLAAFSPLFLFWAQRMLIRFQTFLSSSLSGVINPCLTVMGPRPPLLESNDFTGCLCWERVARVGNLAAPIFDLKTKSFQNLSAFPTGPFSSISHSLFP